MLKIKSTAYNWVNKRTAKHQLATLSRQHPVLQSSTQGGPMAGNRAVLMAASRTEQRLAKSEPPVSLLLHIL